MKTWRRTSRARRPRSEWKGTLSSSGCGMAARPNHRAKQKKRPARALRTSLDHGALLRRGARGRRLGWAGGRGRGGIDRLEVRRVGELVLGDLQDEAVGVVGGHGPLEGTEVDRDLLLTDAQEAADTDDHRGDAAILVDDEIRDLAEVVGLVAGAVVDRRADDLARKMVRIGLGVAGENVDLTAGGGCAR